MSNYEQAGTLSLEHSPDPTQYRLNFGRYQGFTLREIYRTDPLYVRRLAKDRPDLPQLAEGLRLLEYEPVRSGQAGMMATTIFLLLITIILVLLFITLM